MNPTSPQGTIEPGCKRDASWPRPSTILSHHCLAIARSSRGRWPHDGCARRRLAPNRFRSRQTRSAVPRTRATRATIEFSRSDRLDGREQTGPLATIRTPEVARLVIASDDRGHRHKSEDLAIGDRRKSRACANNSWGCCRSRTGRGAPQNGSCELGFGRSRSDWHPDGRYLGSRCHRRGLSELS